MRHAAGFSEQEFKVLRMSFFRGLEDIQEATVILSSTSVLPSHSRTKHKSVSSISN